MKKCDSCGEDFVSESNYAETCEECCDHEFDADEGYHCLNCGKDGSESVMSAAYDRAKDLAKYGE